MAKNSKLKIGFIAWERFAYGGVSRVLSSLLNNISDDFEIKVLCLKDKSFFQNVYNIDTFKIEFSFFEMTLAQKIRRELINKLFQKGLMSKKFWTNYYLPLKYAKSYLLKIAKWINQNEFDIVVFSTGFEDSIQLAALKDLISSNTKIVTWSHAAFTDYFRNKSLQEKLQSIWHKYFKNFDAIVVLSDADCNACKDMLGLDSVRIYNPNSFIPTSHTSLNHKKFLYLGALSETKGSDILIDAFIKFSKFNSEWSLSVYGEGAIKDALEDKINKSNIQDRVSFSPYILDVQNVYCDHDVFILPSRYEGFGVVQIEAASCGLPIIAAELPVTKELISKYKYGVTFKWADSTSLAQRMIDISKSNLTTYSDNGTSAAKDFMPEKIFSEWKSLFNALVNNEK